MTLKTWKPILLLAVCQGLGMSGTSLIATTAALVGYSLAIDKSDATLPLAFQFVVTMLTTIPASNLMRRIGRRSGFWLGAAVGIVGAVIATVSIFQNSFWGFTIGSGVIGVFYGFAIFFRFAAADVAEDRHRARAISLVLTGGVAAAVIGPNLARYSRDFFEPVLFAGCYLSLIFLYLGVSAVLAFVKIPRPTETIGGRTGRPLLEVIRQPVCYTAMFCSAAAYGVMALVMNATPLAMLACNHDFGDTAFVIQWHVLGMYAPSFVTGHLISRFGVLNVMVAGAVLLTACVGVNLSGDSVDFFWVALVLLGVGWNFLFVGATTLLTQSHRPAERAKVQGVNDFLMYGMVTLSALTAGKVQHDFGWAVINLGVVPVIGLAVVAILWLRRHPAAPT
jgi:MFS family permease